jgi:hypothetical protein
MEYAGMSTGMKKARMDGLYLLLLGSAILLCLGTALESASPAAMIDFKGLYFPARCLLHHCDPYQEGQVLRIYRAEEGADPPGSATDREVVTRFVNLPSVLVITLPFAVLPYASAHLIWMALIVGGLIFAPFLILDLAADYAPIVTGALLGFLLANSELQVIDGNAAGIAISLCLVAVWCFLKERFVALGVLCLAISLALKPHDTGMVWLYFLLAGGLYRKRALQTLAVFAILSLPVILWVTHVSPHWMQELHSNMAALSVHGGLNDPSPASTGAHGIGMMINLQTVLSFFRDDPHFYNPATYLICGVLLLAWSFKTLRSRVTPASGWLALGTIAPLSLLPVYHRQGDAILLLLTVPACAMLWAEGGRVARIALLINAAGFVLVGDLTWAIVLGPLSNLHLSLSRQAGRVLIATLVFPTPLILLTMSIFYLWIYMWRVHKPSRPEKSAPAEGASKVTV